MSARQALLFALGLLGSLGLAQAETWRFAAIGDTPYSDREQAELPGMLGNIAEYGAELIIHVGDIKNSQSRCDDSLYAARYEVFNSARIPFILIPGDNEWTDCKKVTAGSFDPLERLQALRRQFWRTNDSLGQQKIRLQRQSDAYPEHQRFQLGPVLFITLNLPGPDNHYSGRQANGGPEFQQRNAASLDWVREAFAQARRHKTAGLVIAFQANPGFKTYADRLAHRGFREFLDVLGEESQGFPGQVLLVHGDTHWNRIDQPLLDQQQRPLSNVTRLETFGYPLMGWTRVIIDPEFPTLFRFENHPWPPNRAQLP